jgi:predicted NAD-dependent protein-ADP-ribosyltransferase YbiA (DUF1768 family)
MPLPKKVVETPSKRSAKSPPKMPAKLPPKKAQPCPRTTKKKATKDSIVPLSESDRPIFFYGASKKNGWLSQMYISKFTHEKRTYVCAEQFIQYAKAAYFEDTVSFGSLYIYTYANAQQKRCFEIMTSESPTRHKALGKLVFPFDPDKWAKGKAWVRVFWNGMAKILLKWRDLSYAKQRTSSLPYPKKPPRSAPSSLKLKVETSLRRHRT